MPWVVRTADGCSGQQEAQLKGRGNTYPPSNPAHPAFGFRQHEVKHFVEDMFRLAAEADLPTNEFFAHQIPGEGSAPARCRSSASPVWTGYLEINGSVGITQFGPTDVSRLTQHTNLQPNSPGWGIFEWHPLYKAGAQDQDLYYQNGCHHRFAGWWRTATTPRRRFSSGATAIFPRRSTTSRRPSPTNRIPTRCRGRSPPTRPSSADRPARGDTVVSGSGRRKWSADFADSRGGKCATFLLFNLRKSAKSADKL